MLTTTASTSRSSAGPPPDGSKCTVVPPLPFGVWPLTATDVRMSICFFLKLRTTMLATSLSRPGRIFGRPSRIVTFEPTSANVLANSQPIAPPPMTIIRSGTRSSIRTSSLVMIGPSGSKPGIVRGTEPEARITASPVSVRGRPVAVGDGDGAAGAEAADAVEDRDLLRLHEPDEALDDPVDDLLLAGLGGGEVDDRGARLDAELGGVGDVALHGRRLQERLGRDAPAVQARAAHDVHLDDGDVEARRGGVQRGAVPAGSAADDDEIEVAPSVLRVHKRRSR